MDETSEWGDEYTDRPLDIGLNSFTIPPGIEVESPCPPFYLSLLCSLQLL